jgi:DNA-binding GntR family transcriptional regulator
VRQLTAEGLLVVTPHRGASVREVSKKELIELFAVREMIEVAAVSIAARLTGETDLIRMQELVDAMKTAAGRGDFRTFSSSGLTFHDELVRLSKNETMIQIYEGVKLRFRRYQFLLAALPDVPQSSTVSHQKILSAIGTRNADLASACGTEHLTHLVARFSEGEGYFADRMVDHRPINRVRNERVGLT